MNTKNTKQNTKLQNLLHMLISTQINLYNGAEFRISPFEILYRPHHVNTDKGLTCKGSHVKAPSTLNSTLN